MRVFAGKAGCGNFVASAGRRTQGTELYCWPQSGRGSADGFVCVSSRVGNPGDSRDLGIVYRYVYSRSRRAVCTVLVAEIRPVENQATADRDAQDRTRRIVQKGQV